MRNMNYLDLRMQIMHQSRTSQVVLQTWQQRLFGLLWRGKKDEEIKKHLQKWTRVIILSYKPVITTSVLEIKIIFNNLMSTEQAVSLCCTQCSVLLHKFSLNFFFPSALFWLFAIFCGICIFFPFTLILTSSPLCPPPVTAPSSLYTEPPLNKAVPHSGLH